MIWGTYILGNHIDPYLVWYIQHAPLRRVSFPMGAFGAPTMKMTVTLSGNIDFRFIMFELQLPTHLPPHSLQLHPGTATAGLLRIWSTLDNLGSLRRPISLKLLREALARTEECVCGRGIMFDFKCGTWLLFNLLPANLCTFGIATQPENIDYDCNYIGCNSGNQIWKKYMWMDGPHMWLLVDINVLFKSVMIGNL